MGFSDVAIQVIIFISVLVVGAMVTIFFNDYSKSAVDSANIQRQELEEIMKTSITIDMISFNSATSPDRTMIYVKNTGRTIIDTEKLDIYLDNIRIPRSTSNRTIQITTDTDTVNVGKLDPKEVMLITIFRNLATGLTHTVNIILDNGVKDNEEFNN